MLPPTPTNTTREHGQVGTDDRQENDADAATSEILLECRRLGRSRHGFRTLMLAQLLTRIPPVRVDSNTFLSQLAEHQRGAGHHQPEHLDQHAVES